MRKSTALIVSSSVMAIFLASLSGCTTPGVQKDTQTTTDIVLTPAETKSAAELEIAQLEQRIRVAEQARDWSQYLSLSEQLWHKADDENQAAIEYMVWHTLSQAFDTPEKIDELSQNSDPKMQQWGSLLDAMQQPGLYAVQALSDVASFETGALYNHHLIQALKERLKTSQSVRQIAVLLPFKGKYQHISEEIRNGLLKAYMISNRSISLKFYDSSNVDEVLQRYQQAKEDGADLVIGPLTKGAVEKLVGHNITDVLALNSADNAEFKTFNFRSQNESMQITHQLEGNAYQRIAILSSDNNRDIETARTLQSQWLSNPDNAAVLHLYPVKNPNLRQALGKIINEEASQARYNNLRWLLSENIEFFPRTRQDLQAIVLIGNEQQVAVFHPQFEFFQLKLPVYATSNLTPNDLQNIKRNKDLENVIFPTIPAVFTPQALNTPLEAFGWDSFMLATQLDKLAPNLCLTQGQSGILYLNEDQQIGKKLIWAQYSPEGLLTPWTKPQEPEILNTPETLQTVETIEGVEPPKAPAIISNRIEKNAVDLPATDIQSTDLPALPGQAAPNETPATP
ncbi:penicillin-binding protein activator [Thiomicrorhabdus sp. ZW0627]|uniref:penicillin-binding protein activator n=1 Tax=Thiomicrorhabdus sp. ZW0627 TaxID=3039774 RepID=UPI0024372888|nr:penicillin-binding protein activator [Thiomicrorhabdus sp. ZW0627]MDG6773999.1 penicillin-binding protein activator [Thiomicrorhabdus sp. ZW0627]